MPRSKNPSLNDEELYDLREQGNSKREGRTNLERSCRRRPVRPLFS